MPSFKLLKRGIAFVAALLLAFALLLPLGGSSEAAEIHSCGRNMGGLFDCYPTMRGAPGEPEMGIQFCQSIRISDEEVAHWCP